MCLSLHNCRPIWACMHACMHVCVGRGEGGRRLVSVLRQCGIYHSRDHKIFLFSKDINSLESLES